CQRPLRFVMHHSFLKLPFTGRFFRDMKVIPIAGIKEEPEILEAAFIRISEELRSGEIVCLFPEGKLTTSGEIAPFRSGIERILRENPVPVIPMHLGGLWQSVFSRSRPRRPLRRIWSRVRLVIGQPLEPRGLSALTLEEHVRALSIQVKPRSQAEPCDAQVTDAIARAAVSGVE
ncbi:MAG TPA: 1-acyl-sn-glycerol-3-phosphate acyltransferase, partial [Polyangiaceae bacterium]|nr:1-acyl-sn-glycerol-3-phosphate acyltransferase [Polyangiaceae bacterium]